MDERHHVLAHESCVSGLGVDDSGRGGLGALDDALAFGGVGGGWDGGGSGGGDGAPLPGEAGLGLDGLGPGGGLLIERHGGCAGGGGYGSWEVGGGLVGSGAEVEVSRC